MLKIASLFFLRLLTNKIIAFYAYQFHLRPYSHLGLDKSTIPGLLTPAEVIDELLVDIPEIVDAVNEVSHLWKKSGDTTKVICPPQENIIMMEEPWMNGNASVPDIDLGKQGLDAATEEIPSSVNLDELNQESSLPSCLENITREDMEIVLLGTGSSQPSKYRNVSSIFINLFSEGGLLLDCGEGTLGQLKRRYVFHKVSPSYYCYLFFRLSIKG